MNECKNTVCKRKFINRLWRKDFEKIYCFSCYSYYKLTGYFPEIKINYHDYIEGGKIGRR